MAPYCSNMEGLTDPSERTDYLTTEYGLTTNAAIALQLAELGFSNSGIASKLDLTEGTVNKYQAQCEEIFGQYVWHALPKPRRYDTFPSDNTEYAGDYINYSPDFTEPDLPRNEGSVQWQDISGKDLTLDLEVA